MFIFYFDANGGRCYRKVDIARRLGDDHPMADPYIEWLVPDDERQADLAVVIVSWNVKDHLLRNLETLAASVGSAIARCIVVDNASKDGTAEAIRNQFPWVQVIVNAENEGFAKACNQGIRMRQSRHVLLLNPDMKVGGHALQRLVDYFDLYPDVSVVGGKLIDEQGTIVKSVRRFPTFWSQLAIVTKISHLFPRVLNGYLWNDFDYAKEQAVPQVRGSFFGIHENALKRLGGLDERYFIWFEEVDYCKKVSAIDGITMYVPMIEATDIVGQSFKQVRFYLSQKRLLKSLITYFDKWHPWWQVWVFRVIRPVALAAAWVADQLYTRGVLKRSTVTKT